MSHSSFDALLRCGQAEWGWADSKSEAVHHSDRMRVRLAIFGSMILVTRAGLAVVGLALVNPLAYSAKVLLWLADATILAALLLIPAIALIVYQLIRNKRRPRRHEALMLVTFPLIDTSPGGNALYEFLYKQGAPSNYAEANWLLSILSVSVLLHLSLTSKSASTPTSCFWVSVMIASLLGVALPWTSLS